MNRVKIFMDYDTCAYRPLCQRLEEKINQWLSGKDVEIISTETKACATASVPNPSRTGETSITTYYITIVIVYRLKGE